MCACLIFLSFLNVQQQQTREEKKKYDKTTGIVIIIEEKFLNKKKKKETHRLFANGHKEDKKNDNCQDDLPKMQEYTYWVNVVIVLFDDE